tara:strand:- start:586 stop:759 length:174 start_codon:yes stop_codon:yes gene_type:complete
MNKYRVYATYVVEVYCDVEAESVDDAYDVAYNIDGGDYTRTENNDDWQIDRIEEVTQ